MTMTVGQLRTQVRRVYSDISDAAFLDLLAEAHVEILAHVRLLPADSDDLTFADTTGVVALANDTLHIWQAVWYDSANSWRILKETSIDELDESYKGWRDAEASSPTMYYEYGGKLCIFPRNSQTTSGGYPFLRIHRSAGETLDDTADTLPAPANHAKAWKDLICRKWAEVKYKKDVAFWDMEAYGGNRPGSVGSVGKLLQYVEDRLIRQKPSIQVKAPRIRMT